MFEQQLTEILKAKGFENFNGASGEANYNRVEYCKGCGGVFKHYFADKLIKAIPANSQKQIIDYVEKMNIW